MMELEIYTDGACSGNPGPGGWAFVIVRPGEGAPEDGIIAERWGAEPETTNNRMELEAVITALETLAGLDLSPDKVKVYTDSQYVQRGISLWINEWKRNKWLTSAKKPVKNRDLWQRLDLLSGSLPLSWIWVKGHAGNVFNERCDRLSRKAAASPGKRETRRG
jgi:ribonuclease HI